MRIFCLNESTVYCSRFLWNTLRCKSGAYIEFFVHNYNEIRMNQNHADNYSQFLHMSCLFVPLFCRLNCSMVSDDEGSDEELDDNCSFENEQLTRTSRIVLCDWLMLATWLHGLQVSDWLISYT